MQSPPATQPTPSATYTPVTATAADSSPTASVLTAAVVGVMDGQRATKESTKEKLEVKQDRLMKQQVAVQQEHVKHLMEMKT